MQEVQIERIPLARLARLLAPERAERLAEFAQVALGLLDGRTVWNVNATATGGGVAEMLQALLAYARGADVDARWLVLDGNPEFFQLTKRIHNLMHGTAGDGGPLGEDQRSAYEAVLADNLESLRSRVKPGDIVLLHDPQTAGLVEGVKELDVHTIWRSHIGRDTPNERTDQAWEFLRPYVEPADAMIFTRAAYAPTWVDANKVRLIPPSLDPFTAKNCDLTEAEIQSALGVAGLMDFSSDHGSHAFTRRDGSKGQLRPHRGLIHGDQVVPSDARLVMQVSRWDRLKDMEGVLRGFADHLDKMPEEAHLMLVGPDVSGVSDDPEGAEVLQECIAVWEGQDPDVRRRLHLCSLPMDDTDENAHLVNALQRRANVVVQKSLVEGFGLTVTEPMWKARAVVASRVGGIQDQIIDDESGVLLDDPEDLDAFAEALVDVLQDDDVAYRLGSAAQERVRDQYLGDRHLIQYVELFEQLSDS